MTFVCLCGITTCNRSERTKHFRSKRHKNYISLLERGICYVCKEQTAFYFSGICLKCDKNNVNIDDENDLNE